MEMTEALLDCKMNFVAALRRLSLAAMLVALAATPALAFDFARYQAADLDEVLAKPRPKSDLDLRPVFPGTTQTDAVWQARYGDDPSMDWSRYDPVAPQKFDADVFGGRKHKP
jgi:hypothetical protein